LHDRGTVAPRGTSVGYNFCAACRARPRADFIAGLKMVEEECDESIYRLELLSFLNLKTDLPLHSVMEEADQILSIVVASITTARPTYTTPLVILCSTLREMILK
jgi:four helix bundle protein